MTVDEESMFDKPSLSETTRPIGAYTEVELRILEEMFIGKKLPDPLSLEDAYGPGKPADEECEAEEGKP